MPRRGYTRFVPRVRVGVLNRLRRTGAFKRLRGRPVPFSRPSQFPVKLKRDPFQDWYDEIDSLSQEEEK